MNTKKTNILLSVIIVNYKTELLTCQCIQSLIKSVCDFEFEIIVVDNASGDGSVEAIKEKYSKKVIIIENDENLGFSKANNIGIDYATGEYILLLNSDAEVNHNTLSKSVEYIQSNDNIGALGCKVILPDGRLDAACKRSFPTPANGFYHSFRLDRVFQNSKVFGEYNLTYLDDNKINEVDCIVGAFMLVPKKVIEEIGKLDETFFMYGEDVDWCYRIIEKNYKIVYYPEVEILHNKRASGIGKRNEKVINAFYDSMIIFYEKHYKEKYPRLVRKTVYFGVSMLKKLALFKNKLKKKK